jgi:hypothetical protein
MRRDISVILDFAAIFQGITNKHYYKIVACTLEENTDIAQSVENHSLGPPS